MEAIRFGSKIDGADSQTFYLFELTSDGTITYSRSLEPELSGEAVIGLNLFDDLNAFEDMGRYRHNFQSFVKSNKGSDKFIWRRSGAAKSGRDASVFMTRASSPGSSAVVMMEFRA